MSYLAKENGSQEIGDDKRYGYVTVDGVGQITLGQKIARTGLRVFGSAIVVLPLVGCLSPQTPTPATRSAESPISGDTPVPATPEPTVAPEKTATPVATKTVEPTGTPEPTATNTPIPLSPDYLPAGPSGAGGNVELSPSQKQEADKQWESWKPYVERMQVEGFVSGAVGENNPTGLEMHVERTGLSSIVMYAVMNGKVIFPNNAGFEVGQDNGRGLDLPAMPSNWSKTDLVELSPGGDGEYVTWLPGLGTFVSVGNTGEFSRVYKDGEWKHLEDVGVPSGVDANVWRMAVTMGGAEGAVWDNQLGTVVWSSGDEVKAWDPEFNYMGVVVGSGSGRLVARHNFDRRPSSAESGGASFDYQGNFTGLGVDIVKYVSQEGITQASIGFTSKVVGFERLIIDPLVNNTNDLFGLKADDIAMWDTVVLETVVNGAPTKVHVLLRPDGVPKMDHIIEDGSGARPSDVANIFSTIDLGDIVFYYTSVVTEAPTELDFCNLRIKSGERQYQVWQAVGAARIMTSSTRRLGLEIDGDGKSWCQPLLMDNDIDTLVKSVGPLYPGGYWTIARK